MKKILLCLTCCTLYGLPALKAQRTIHFTQPEASLFRAAHTAQWQLFAETEATLEADESIPPIDAAQSTYLRLLSALRLHRPGSEAAFRKYLSTLRQPPLQALGHYELARHCVRQQRFAEARDGFEQVAPEFLSKDERRIRNRELTYAYLATGRTEAVSNLPPEQSTNAEARYRQALRLFSAGQIVQGNAQLHSLEQQADYRTALRFHSLEADYLSGKTDGLEQKLREALPETVQPALYQLMGQLAMDQLNFSQAEKYFRLGLKAGLYPRREDQFRLAYCCYQTGQWKEAQALFTSLYRSQDMLSQYSAYYTAQCYLSMQEFSPAYNALLECVNINQDTALTETAEFHLAKISLQTGDEKWAGLQLESFIRRYPGSTYLEEAISLRINWFIRQGRLSEAQHLLSAQGEKREWQDLFYSDTYEEALRMLEQQQAAAARDLLEAGLPFASDEKKRALSAFWLAETDYRLGRYAEALTQSDTFLNLSSGKAAWAAYEKKIRLLRCYLYRQLNQTDDLRAEYAMLYPGYRGDPGNALGTIRKELSPLALNARLPHHELLPFQLPEAPFPFRYTPYVLLPQSMADEGTFRSSYILGGIGNLANRELEAGVDLSEWLHTPVYARGAVSGLQGKLPNQAYRDARLGLHSSFRAAQHEVYTFCEWSRNTQSYYGYDHSQYNYEAQSIRQQFNNLSIGLALSPQLENPLQLHYNPSIRLGRYSDRFQANETMLQANIPVEKQLNEEATALLGVQANLHRYESPLFSVQNNSLLSLRPAIRYRWHGLQLFAGLYPTLGQDRHLLPDFSASYPVPALQAQISLHYQGQIHLNTFRELSTLNPFIFNSFRVKQSREQSLTLGLNGTLGTHGSYTLRGGIGSMTNLPLFLNDTAGDFKQFHVLFDERARLLIGDVQLDFRAGNLMTLGGRIQARPVFSLSTYEKAWHYVPATIDLHSNMPISRSLSLQTEVFIRFGYPHFARSTGIQSLFTQTANLGLDLNLLADLHLSRRWNAYMQVYNVLGTAYQRWYGYSNLGTHFRTGLLYRFGPVKN